jgi:hypothetical protein
MSLIKGSVIKKAFLLQFVSNAQLFSRICGKDQGSI